MQVTCKNTWFDVSSETDLYRLGDEGRRLAEIQRHDGNTERLARKSYEALRVRVLRRPYCSLASWPRTRSCVLVTTLPTKQAATNFNWESTSTGMKEQEKWEIPEKTRRPTASSSTIPTCENLVTRSKIEPVMGSMSWSPASIMAGGRCLPSWWSLSKMTVAYQEGGSLQKWRSPTKMMVTYKNGGRLPRWWSFTKIVVAYQDGRRLRQVGGPLNIEVLRADEGDWGEYGSAPEWGGTGDLRENPPTNGIVLHDSHIALFKIEARAAKRSSCYTSAVRHIQQSVRERHRHGMRRAGLLIITLAFYNRWGGGVQVTGVPPLLLSGRWLRCWRCSTKRLALQVPNGFIMATALHRRNVVAMDQNQKGFRKMPSPALHPCRTSNPLGGQEQMDESAVKEHAPTTQLGFLLSHLISTPFSSTPEDRVKNLHYLVIRCSQARVLVLLLHHLSPLPDCKRGGTPMTCSPPHHPSPQYNN
ncbi:hypothetical protein PR048_012159 [Dryococelus australis]|uniref:Uncharacterized protein n=1 Tax=Dryococelus australis TaxID=614101 RepID=A0ABQ9HPV0_9NEOP|nr:hypothetical protein PR048_012159 [Dryococelus australis]